MQSDQVLSHLKKHGQLLDLEIASATGKYNFARVDESAFFCIPNLGRSIIKGVPTGVVPAVSAVPEVTAEDENDEDQVDDADDGAEIKLPSDGLPVPDHEADQWELRHARRRSAHHPDRNPDSDGDLYQAVIEKLDRMRTATQ